MGHVFKNKEKAFNAWLRLRAEVRREDTGRGAAPEARRVFSLRRAASSNAASEAAAFKFEARFRLNQHRFQRSTAPWEALDELLGQLHVVANRQRALQRPSRRTPWTTSRDP